jgi:hypothetical protein
MPERNEEQQAGLEHVSERPDCCQDIDMLHDNRQTAEE